MYDRLISAKPIYWSVSNIDIFVSLHQRNKVCAHCTRRVV